MTDSLQIGVNGDQEVEAMYLSGRLSIQHLYLGGSESPETIFGRLLSKTVYRQLRTLDTSRRDRQHHSPSLRQNLEPLLFWFCTCKCLDVGREQSCTRRAGWPGPPGVPRRAEFRAAS